MLARAEKIVTERTDRELVFTRVFDAPRELVWMAWSDSKHIGQWWGPQGFTTTTYSMDFKPGGIWRFVMHGPDGTDYQNKIVYLEIVKPERLVFKHSGGEEDAEKVSHQTTVTFAAEGDKTKLTMRMLFSSAEELQRVVDKYGAIEGGKQTLGRLAEYVEKASFASEGSHVK
jgi:uncharacterized protein YndB with AHSA1/START domain